MPLKDDDIAREAPRQPAQRASPEDASSGVRNKSAPGPAAELDVGPLYALHAPMGETAYGRAFRAEHLPTRREVAVHVLPIDDEREARDLPLAFAICAQLSHPHVVGLESHGRAQPDGPYYLVTQALEGQSLAMLLDDEGTFDLVRVLPLARQIAQVLRAAHKLHIVHGALSPANIRLVTFEDVRVVGFGAASFRPPPVTGARAVRAPRPYEAPELTRGALPDLRADVFALGCLLFRMLTGKVPTVREGEPPPSLSAHSVQPVPPELDALVAGCLAPDPGARIDDTVVLIGKLREILATEKGIDASEGWPHDSFPPKEEASEERAPGPEPSGEPEGEPEDEPEMMGGSRGSALWVFAGLSLVLFALWLLWEASTRS